MQPRALLLCLAGLLITMPGCANGSRDTVTLRITDTAAQPVPGARISIAPMNFYIPAYPFSHLSEGGLEPAIGVADAAGLVELNAPRTVPSRIQVDAIGYVQHIAILEYRLGTWTIAGRSESQDNDRPRLQVNLYE